MFDDIFPKQSLGPTPKNEMRKTMGKVGVDGFRTQIVTLPNGDTAIYKSKNGHPEFVVQRKPVKLTPVEVLDVLYSTRYVTVGLSPVYRHTIAGSLCTEVVEADKQLPRKNYWQGTAVSVPISYNGPTTGAWIIKYGLYDARSLYSDPFVAYRNIGGTVYRRELDLSNKGTIVLTEKLHPSGVQVYKYYQGYHHDTPGDLEPLVGNALNNNRFMSLSINASGSKARCLAKPTAGGPPPLRLYEYDLDARSVSDLGLAISYAETETSTTYSGSAEHTWAVGFELDAAIDLKSISSSSSVTSSYGSLPSTIHAQGTYYGSFSLLYRGVALFTIAPSFSSVSDTYFSIISGSYVTSGLSICETDSLNIYLLYANLAQGVVCVRVSYLKHILTKQHSGLTWGGWDSPAYAGKQTNAWENLDEVQVYKDGVLIYASDEFMAAAHGNNFGSDVVSLAHANLVAGATPIEASFSFGGPKGGASDSSPFGYVFSTDLASGAVRRDGLQIAIVYKDLAVVVTKVSGGWVAAKMPSMLDNTTQTGNLIQTQNVAYDYNSQVIL